VVSGKEVELPKLVVSRTCKEFGYYKNPHSMSPYQAAQKMIAAGYDFTAGMKVAWIVTNSKYTPIHVEPYMEGVPFTHIPDYQYYARRLAHTLSNLTDAFGWDESSLLTGKKQTKLGSFEDRSMEEEATSFTDDDIEAEEDEDIDA